MKTLLMIFVIIFLDLLLINVNKSEAQTLQLNVDITKDTVINPFIGTSKLYSLKINGTVKLHSDTSLLRVILSDLYGNKLLVYEAYPLITIADTFYIQEGCDEICFSDGLIPGSLHFEINNCQLLLDSVQIETNEIKDATILQAQFKSALDSLKISILNREIKKYKMYWLAGKTYLNDWSYQDREHVFGSKYNLMGFDYYRGGIFEFLHHRVYSNTTNNYVTSFNWKTRHSVNQSNSPYFDGDYDYLTGWITPVRNQLSCGTCSIFATVAAVESRLNLYYNIHDKNNPHHADVNISEQDIRNCPTLMMNCQTGSYPYQSYVRLKDYRCRENDYMYDPGNIFCNKPSNCEGEVKIQTYTHTTCYPNNEDIFKKRLMDFGPLTVSIPLFPIPGTPPSAHAVAVVGFELVEAGKIAFKSKSSKVDDIVVGSDSPLIGATIYNFKNSWGYNPTPGGSSTWGEDGFGYIGYNAFDSYDFATGKVYWEGKNEDPNSATSSIVCSDEDGDGYYWWGISQPTPCATCPPGISTLEDCDDSNRDLGPYDATYACVSNCESLEQTYTVPLGNSSIDNDVHQKMHILIPAGATLTLNKTLYMAPGRKITVKKGGMLIVSGTGRITAACSQLWQGIEVEGTSLTQSAVNQGSVEMQAGGILENAICAIKSITAPSQQQSGAIVKANGSIFRNNRESLNLSNYSGIINSSLTRFGNCVFETKGELLDGSAPVNFVRLENLTNATGIKFQGCSFTETDNLRKVYGIRTYNAFFECKSNGSVNTSFNNLVYGIYASSGSLLTAVKINNCLFTNNYRAIYLSGCQTPQITFNSFNVPNIDTHWIPMDGFTAYGVYLDASTGYKVEDNTIYCDTYGDQVPVYISTCGIYVRNSGAVANEIYRNTFSNLQCALAAYGINRNGQNEGLVFKCNTFTNCGTDIGVYRGTLPLTANIGIKRDQGDYNTTDPAKSAGNVFTSLSFQYHTKDIDNASCMPLRYNHHRSQSIPGNLRMIPSPAISPGVYEIHDNTSSIYSSSLSCPTILGDNFNSNILLYQVDSLNDKEVGIKNSLLQQVDGGNTESTVEDVINSTSNETLDIYTDLITKSPFLSDTVMKTAVMREDLIPEIMLRDILVANPQSAKSDTVLNSLENRFTLLNDTLMGDIMANEFILGDKEILELQRADVRQHYGIVLNNKLLSVVNDTMSNPTDSILVVYNKSNRLSDKYSLSMQYSANGNLASAEAILNSISKAAYPDNFNATEHNSYDNWIKILNRALENEADLTFDTLQINALWGLIIDDSAGNYYPTVLARNCLLNARLLTYQEPLVFDQEMKSRIVRKHYPKIITPSGASGYLKVFPIPARDYIIIEYQLNNDCTDGLIQVYSSEGKKLLKVPVYSTKSEIILPVNKFSGSLLISLQGCSGMIDSQKIVVDK